MKKLTQKRLKEVLDYNPDTGFFKWKINKSKCSPKNKIAGSYNGGYIQISIDKIPNYAHRLVWLYIYGYFPKNEIDHINKVKNDNRFKNLREVSRSCNMKNCNLSKRTTTGITGVYWNKQNNKWQAGIRAKCKQRHLGFYKNKIDAVKARWRAEKKYNFTKYNLASTAYNYLKNNNLIP